jgi:hypothetical protein
MRLMYVAIAVSSLALVACGGAPGSPTGSSTSAVDDDNTAGGVDDPGTDTDPEVSADPEVSSDPETDKDLADGEAAAAGEGSADDQGSNDQGPDDTSDTPVEGG